MKILYLFFICALFSIYTVAQENTHVDSNSSALEPVSETLEELSIFDNDEPLKLTLKYDITSFIRHKTKGEYLDAELRIRFSETDSIVKNIRLKARGNARREQCFFPPIYLNFKTDPLTNTELSGVKKIKLVTHCSTAKSYQDYILKEFLIYKLNNVLMENSLRVKMLDITYIDTGKKGRNYHQRGFLIEPLEVLCHRLGATEINSAIVKGPHIVESEMDVAALFNYMVGNTDWRVRSGHNMKFVKLLTNLSSEVTPVLYDFDLSGLIGASYAIPQEWTRIKTVQEREYLGYCRDSDEAYLNAIKVFTQKKDEVLKTINTFDFLGEKDRKSVYKYIEGFYNLTKKPKVLVGIMKRECRSADF